VEFEARNLMASCGYYAFRNPGACCSVNLVGIMNQDILLAQVRRSRTALPGIREVNAFYREDLDALRRLGSPRCCRKEVWIYSGQEGFRFYEVFPGGLQELGEP
jgi:hypothetical protein